MEDKPLLEPFSRSSGKTYSLVELVHRAPAMMVDHGPDDTVFAFPIVAFLEVLMTLGVSLLLVWMSLAVNAPLEEIANPNQTTDPAKAPWYFMGLQELLEHGHPTLMAVILPTIMVIFVMLIPYLDNDAKGAGRWFTNRRGKRIAARTAIYALVVMPAYIYIDSTFPPRELLRGILPDLISQGLIPAVIMGAIILAPMIFLLRQKPTPREILLFLFTMLFVSAVVFTLTGFLFRGPGFKLYLPWDMPGGYNPFSNL